MHLEYDAVKEIEQKLDELDPAPSSSFADVSFDQLLAIYRLERQQYDRVPDSTRRDLLVKASYALKPAALANLGKLKLDINEEKLTAELCYSGKLIVESGRNDDLGRPPLLSIFLELSKRFGAFLLTAEKDGFMISLHADIARSIKAHDYSEQIEALRHPRR